MKKAELSDSFGKIMGATLKEAEHEDEKEDDEELKAGYHKKMETKTRRATYTQGQDTRLNH